MPRAWHSHRKHLGNFVRVDEKVGKEVCWKHGGRQNQGIENKDEEEEQEEKQEERSMVG